MKIDVLRSIFNLEKVKQKCDNSEKRSKMAEKIFFILGRTRKSIQFGKLDQKSLFFIWFFIDNGQKTYEKIRKNWIQMRLVSLSTFVIASRPTFVVISGLI